MKEWLIYLGDIDIHVLGMAGISARSRNFLPGEGEVTIILAEKKKKVI